jgi:hypothetical protein
MVRHCRNSITLTSQIQQHPALVQQQQPYLRQGLVQAQQHQQRLLQRRQVGRLEVWVQSRLLQRTSRSMTAW